MSAVPTAWPLPCLVPQPPARILAVLRRVRAALSGLGAGTPGTADPGAPQTIADLYRVHRLALVRTALLLVDDLHTAEDVVQDAFAAVCRRHGMTPSDLDDAAAYLTVAVCNAARSVLRRRRTARAYTPPVTTDGLRPEERLLLKEEHEQVMTALRQLTGRQREVLVLRYWSNLSEAQIAHTLGLSRGTVKSTASRGLDALERILASSS
ncbi:MAG: polymerase, sigma-24 subunit, subfamily [Actinomycetia bacterium]|jgi:RNA polymerase sigma-70 factor (sigma-E family)|nr:polymerase, sigma-24 subunit, subfamily [Actinomycetes bacterium]